MKEETDVHCMAVERLNHVLQCICVGPWVLIHAHAYTCIIGSTSLGEFLVAGGVWQSDHILLCIGPSVLIHV